jgi:UPF0716 family protein affecting phage T7 exclusion
VLAALLLIVPGWVPTIAGALLALPVLLRQWAAWRRNGGS